MAHDALYLQEYKQTLEDAQSGILKRGINDDRYNDMMFDLGCQFADRFARNFIVNSKLIAEKLKNDKDWRFWNWWVVKWRLDDAALLKGFDIDTCNYPELKETLIGDALMEKELYHIVIDKINKL